MKPNSGSFKRGGKPGNEKPLGHERIDARDKMVRIKVNERDPYTGARSRYVLKHRWLWEQHNGPIPDGHVIAFINGDSLDLRLDNLECVSRAEMVRRNQLQLSDAPPELRPTLRALAKMQTVMYDKMR